MAKKRIESELTALHRLYKAAGAGIPIEPMGIFIGGETLSTWLHLVAKGYCYGLNGRLRITSLGRDKYKASGMTQDKFERITGAAA